MQLFMRRFYYWFAITPVRTMQNTWLSTDLKLQYSKYAKQAIIERFPEHPLFSPAYVEWHNDNIGAD